MIRSAIVETINKQQGFYAPHVRTNISLAAIPEELIDKIQIGDHVMIFYSEKLTYGGFKSIVIETPRAKLTDL